MALTDGNGLPLALCLASASPHERTLVEETLERSFLPILPTYIIADKAYDSDALDTETRERFGAEIISPHRRGRKRNATQDGRKLRRYRRRWKVERLFAWLHNWRRVVIRWDYHAANFLAFVKLACIMQLMRRCL